MEKKMANAGVLACSLLLIPGMNLVAQNGAVQKTLNIVFILADDMGWKDLGCYGSFDYLPTFCELTGISTLPKNVDGQSILHLLL